MIQKLILALGLTVSIQIRAATCRSTPHTERVNVVQVGTQFVTIIGWSRLGSEDVGPLLEKLDASLSSARAKDCQTAKLKLEEAVAALGLAIEQKNFVTVVLEAANKDTPLKKIGLELTPEEYQNDIKAVDGTRAKFNEIRASCPATSENISKLLEVAQGPELTFALRYAGQSMLIPLEDSKAKAENEKAFQGNLPFNDRDPRIDSASNAALVELHQFALAQETPDESVFDRAVAFANPAERPGLKKELKTSFEILLKRFHGAYVRNEFIARNAMAINENIAVVVGYSHVKDLVQKLMEQCQKR